MADKKIKEVKREDVLAHPEVYKEHFTEEMLVTKAQDFVYNHLYQNNIYGEGKWEGDRAVYAQLPFGEPAVYVVKMKDKKGTKTVKATVTALLDVDAEEITIGVDAPGIPHGEKVISHLTIKHGYINWYELDAPKLDIGEPVIVMTDAIKDDLPKYGTTNPKLRQQPQIPYYMLPPMW